LGIIALASLNTFRKEHIAEAFRYPSTSMEPTLQVGDHFIVDRRRLARMPLRQALVAYESVETPGLKVAKRFVGMPDDTIEMRAGAVFLNGRPLEEPYLAPAREVYEADSALRKQMRAWQSPYLAGRKDSGYWPTLNDWGPLVVPPDSYFALGDNRNTSYDSRETGFIPVSHILGRASHIYLSIDPAGGIRWSRLGKALR
jgi:signal peptidase I